MTGAVGAASARGEEPGPDSATLAPGPHGGDGAAVARQLGLDPAAMLDLSASLNPLAPDVAALVRRLDDTAVGTYPDAGPATQALAEAMGVAADRLLLTNGGAEAIALVAAEHPVGTVPEPAFSLYRRHLVEADAADHDQRALVWSANPTSPWGEIAPPDQAADVWDEAFWPLATGSWTRGDAGAYRIGSLTKLWACPGLRLGFVIAPTPDQRDALLARQPRWSVNGLAIGVLPELLAATDLARWQRGIADLRSDLAELWRGCGFVVHESSANWVLVEDAARLRLPMARAGVLVRDCSSFGLPGMIRVAVPGPHGIEAVGRALATVHRGRPPQG